MILYFYKNFFVTHLNTVYLKGEEVYEFDLSGPEFPPQFLRPLSKYGRASLSDDVTSDEDEDDDVKPRKRVVAATSG